jgi:predicted transcriptional regulator
MSLDLLLVSSVMSKDVKTETEDQNLMAVCRVMHENNVGSVIITKIQDKQRIPTGIITERDIVRFLGKLTIDLRKPISDFMSKPIISIQSNSSIREAVHLMNSNNIRRLVVVDNENNMVGIITEKDIFREISKNQTLITSFIGENYPSEYGELYTRFTDYMFDLLPKL